MLPEIEAAMPPAHLLPGSGALRLVRDRLADLTQDLDTWEEVTASTDG
ncbi:short-chain dehydrogenase [Massilia sp. JS1662]|nr:hypothetical protein [Massilia sp. JS1662]KGF83436.1 short-chain dehydrogenase [Massilia sp. JS1662]